MWKYYHTMGEEQHYASVLRLFVIGRLDMYRTKVLMYRMMVLMVRLTKVRC